ncbi:protein PHOX1-like isoform X2 [Diospyros lotus]|uniref:protein PHOX1-like isoform X2 n=1 Tax=Diospyros lotus TaxID=55363 RepID=UPI00225906D3|nr:protein PHOX1-like isoform X2 [Diospyros lotus]
MMGKQNGNKKKQVGEKSGVSGVKESKFRANSSKAYDEDTAVFVLMAQELKDDGNKFFQKRDYEGAMLKYEKAIKLLPRNHIDVSYLRSNMAACYMQMGLSEYPRAIHECNLALEVTPKYSKALLKRARCYEALNRLDLALRDVKIVLGMEPNNIMATEIEERVRTTIEKKCITANEIPIDLVPEYVDPVLPKLSKDKTRKKKSKKLEGMATDGETVDKVEDKAEEKTDGEIVDKVEDKVKEKKAEEKTNNHRVKDEFEEKKAEENTNKKVVKDEFEEQAAEEKANKEVVKDEFEEKKAEEKTNKNVVKDEFEEKKAEETTNRKTVKDEFEEKKAEGTTNRKTVKDELEEKKATEKTNKKKVKDEFEETKTKEKTSKKKAEKTVEGMRVEVEKNAEDKAEKTVEGMRAEVEEKKAEDKLVVEEKISNVVEEEPKRNIKLVFGDDIRWAQLPFNCSILILREVIRDRFPASKAVLIKYRDQEGDLVTITSNEELRWAEASADQGSLRLHIFEVKPEQDPFYGKVKREEELHKPNSKHSNSSKNGSLGKGYKTEMGPSCIDDWIVQFAQLFKNYVGFNSDAYLDLHELGMKLYSEAMEETVTSEEAQDLFNIAAEKFQEMAALALFNWGNVHMSRARRRVYFTEDASKESVLTQIQTGYDWAQKEYLKAGERYEEAVRIKPDFYEGILALGQQKFEQAKLSWYYAVSTNVDLETWPSTEVLQLYNVAEDNMEKGMQMWEEAEEQRLNELSKPNKVKNLMQQMGIDGLYKDISAEEAADQGANMRSQINLLWGTMLYERSIMEFKLELPVWHECLEVAIEKFELAGASATDIAVMMKNHCSNDTALDGLGFNIDEIIQAWNEMYEAKRWQSDVPSFRLEPVLRRRVSKLYHVLEHA